MTDNKYNFVTNYKDLNLTVWENLVNNSNQQNVFQTSSMFKFWQSQDNCEPDVFAIKQKDNLLAICVVVVQSNGGGLKKYFSRRAIIYGGPIISSDCNQNEVFDMLLREMNQHLRSKAIYAEFRHTNSYQEFDMVYKKNNYEYIPYQNFKIKLTNEDELFSNLTSEKRRQIRRSFREGVEICYDNTEENIKGVYEIINTIYIEKIKKPLPGFLFFNDMANTSFGNVVALKYNDKIIGGGFLVLDKNTVYDWYRGGLDREYKHQFPSTVAAWAVIKFGLDKKLNAFDFMGAGIKGEEYGVRNFKAQYGGELVEHGRYNLVFKPTLFKAAKFGLSLLSKI